MRRGHKKASLDEMKTLVGAEPIDGQPTAETGLIEQERAELVHAALAELSIEHRQIIGAARNRWLPLRRDRRNPGPARGHRAEPLVPRTPRNARPAHTAIARRKNRRHTMSDKPSNYELDDELLSAYLDGELSADERAAVEARLATDPAAQQLLHELRSVSQSVQALPTESLGRDLSEEIIRRAREAAPTPRRIRPQSRDQRLGRPHRRPRDSRSTRCPRSEFSTRSAPGSGHRWPSPPAS